MKYDLCLAYKEEEMSWSHKNRERWLKDGDGNNKYYHALVKAYRTRNSLESLLDTNENVQRSEASKGEAASIYFSNLFASSNLDNFHQIFSSFIPSVTPEMNAMLIGKVTKEEIKETVFFS